MQEPVTEERFTDRQGGQMANTARNNGLIMPFKGQQQECATNSVGRRGGRTAHRRRRIEPTKGTRGARWNLLIQRDESQRFSDD